MKNDLVPVTATWLKTNLEKFQEGQMALVEKKRVEYLERMRPLLTSRRLFGILGPVYTTMPSDDEIIEYGKLNCGWYPYYLNLEDRVKKFVDVMQHVVEASAYQESIYLTPHTIELILDTEYSFPGYY